MVHFSLSRNRVSLRGVLSNRVRWLQLAQPGLRFSLKAHPVPNFVRHAPLDCRRLTRITIRCATRPPFRTGAAKLSSNLGKSGYQSR